VTIATIDGGSGADAYLRFNTNGVEKAYIKQGSGGNTIITNDVAGKNLQLQARPSAGAAATYLFLDGGSESILMAKPVSASSTLHHVGAATFGSTLAVTGAMSGTIAEFTVLTASTLVGGSPLTISASEITISGSITLGGTGSTDSTVSASSGEFTALTASAISGGSPISIYGDSITLIGDGSIYVLGALSASSTFHAVGATTLGSTLAVTGNITTAGDLILDDGGSIKEGGGTAAITIDASGEVTKIGQDSPSTNEVLTWDGAKWVAAAAGSGTATAVSGTTAQLTTGVETSGYLKVSGSSTLGPLTATTYSGSGTSHVVGAATFSSTLAVTGAVTATGINSTELISGSLGMHVDSPVTFGSTLNVTGNILTPSNIKSTAGYISASLQVKAQKLVINGITRVQANGDVDASNLSASHGMHVDQGATFGSTVASSGSVTAVGLYSTELISGSLGMHVDSPVTLGGTLAATGSVTAGGILSSQQISGSQGLHIDQNATFGDKVMVTSSLGVGTATPLTALDVHHDPTALTNDTGGGEVVKFGTGTLTTGKTYYLHTGSSWEQTDIIKVESGAVGMVGIAMGSTPATNGVLIRGFFDVHSYLSGTFAPGQPVFLGAPGYITTMRPSGSTEIVRQVGYCTTTANVIYFNPSSEYIELT
tara:strand:- start:1842 stop:3806 length:1965 start_codon:yes stop_codon:yes gene_type:complete